MRAWLVGGVIALLGVAMGAQTAAPPATDYPAAVRAYVGLRDAVRAVAGIAALTPSQFETAIDKYRAQPQPMFAAAAVLQLEIGLGVVIDSPAVAARHLEFGHRLIRDLRETGRNVPPMSLDATAIFAERWYVAAASV